MLERPGLGPTCRRIACLILLCASGTALGSDRPLLGLAKNASASQYLGDNVFETQIQLTVANMGNALLTGMSVQDDLSATFSQGTTWFEVVPGSLQSDRFQINPNFDGDSDPELLADGNALPVEQSARIQFLVRFKVTEPQGTFYNTAYSESIECVPDNSTDGLDPDPDGNGRPTERTPTPIQYEVPRQPVLGIAKRADATEYLDGNRFQATIHILAENLGNTELLELQITDDLTATFGNETLSYQVVEGSVTSPTLATNAGFDGDTDQNLLMPGNSLAVGAVAEVSFTVQFEVQEEQGEFLNSATGVSIDCIPDRSTNGTDPDPNGDGNPDESRPTPIAYQLPAQRRIGLAKSADPTEHEQDRTFVTPLSFRLQNFGNRALEQLQITDDLAGTFGDRVSEFRVVSGSLRSDQLQVNPAFNGTTNQNLLAEGNVLGIDETAQLSLRVRFTTLDDAGFFENSAFANCSGCQQDTSTDGLEPDPDGNGEPSESAPTRIAYAVPEELSPRLGLAKSATFAETTQGDERETTIHLRVQNYGNATAQNINIQDDLTPTFERALPFLVQTDSLSSAELTVNPNYNGASDVSLLAPGQLLEPGASASVSYRVRFRVNEDTGRLFNQATASAANGATDSSTNGDDPDPNADGMPQEDEPTPIPYGVVQSDGGALPQLQIEVTPKPRITRVGRVVGYSIRVTNTITDPQPEVVVTDLGPDGFQPQLDQVVLVRTGPDGRFDTPDDERRPLGASGARLVTYEAFPLAPLEVARIDFPSRVTSAARLGPHPNKSTADSAISAQVSDDAQVEVIADVLFSRATILGKVFHDRNGDGVQGTFQRQRNDGSIKTIQEEGVPAARLITPEGLIVKTDNHGRFHIADIEVNGRFGENYVLKLDERSLPLNAVSTSDTRQIVRVQQGGIGKANFAVRWTDRGNLDRRQCCKGQFLHLDQLGLAPTEKKLDVALQQINPTEHASGYHLDFLVQSNYPDSAQCLQMAVYPQGYEQPIYAKPRKSIQTKTRIALSIPEGANQTYSYRVFAYRANEQGECIDLQTDGSSGYRPTDSTWAQRFETPPQGASLPIRLPQRALDSSLQANRLNQPPAIPQLSVRKYKSGYRLSEILTSDPDLVAARTQHRWQAIEQRRLQNTQIAPGNSLETSGYELPAQIGGATGTVVVARDHNAFNDQVIFSATGRNASMSCCDVKSSVSSSLDTTRAVYAHKFTNEHSEALDICVLPSSGNATQAAAAAERCWRDASGNTTKTIRPGNSFEFFSGRFSSDRPIAGDNWDQLYLFQRISDPKPPTSADSGFAGGFQITRVRTADGIWTQPKVVGICDAVSSEIDITRSNGLAAHKLRSEQRLDGAEPDTDDWLEPLGLGSDLYLGIVDLSFGGSSASGDLSSLAAQNGFDDPNFIEGRVAGYWRGNRLLGQTDPKNLSWVVQLDTTKDELSALGKNLERKDPRRLFRQLDVDRYYPTYGDDSSTLLDTNSQGAAYARVRYQHSEASWGNYRADFSDTEFSHFTRTLYGLNATHNSTGLTATGAHRFSLQGFASEAQSVSAHMTFLATGGSLYYLKHTDILMGSERLWVEIRRRGTEQIDSRRALVAGRDYEIDPLQGRILLSRPLAQLVREQHNPVVRHRSAEGDQVQLRVDYEYRPEGFTAEDLTYGLRAKAWITDRLRLGATQVTDEQGSSDLSLYGLDLLYRPSKNSYLALEWADTKANNHQNSLVSLDGGLSLVQHLSNSAGDLDGQAFGLDAQLALADLGLGEGTLRAWRKQRDAGYSSSRFGVGPKVVDSGFDFDLRLDDSTRLTGGALELRRQGASRYRSARVQLSKQWRCTEQPACWLLDVEGRYDNGNANLGASGLDPTALYDEGSGSILGLRLGRQLSPNTTLYGNLQAALTKDSDFGNSDRVALGVNQRLSEHLALSLELSEGHRGGAVTGGFDYRASPEATFNLSTGVGPGALTQASTRLHLSDGQELYGSYTMSPDRTDGTNNILAFGQRRQLSEGTHVYSESQFAQHLDQTSNGHLFGIDWRLANNLVLATTMQGSRVQTPTGDFDRLALSLGGSYASENLRLHSRIELRKDDGINTEAKQYVMSNALNYRINDNARFQGKLNAALVEDELSDRKLGRFVELNLGYAYRPTQSDRWNTLWRYSYLLDVGTQGQSETPGDERSHLFGAEGFLEANRRVQFGAKLASRTGQSRSTKGQGPWFDVKLGMAIARVLVRFGLPDSEATAPKAQPADLSANNRTQRRFRFLPNKLELQAEYRWLKDWEGQTKQQGLLLGLFHTRDSRNANWTLSNSLRFGLGYNFSGFDDNLRRTSFRADGWFVDFSAAF